MTDEIFKCTACNADVYIESTKCQRCGADLESQKHAASKVAKKSGGKTDDNR